MQKIILNTDGGSRGNPGPGAIGVVISNEQGNTLKEYGEAIGECTNNEAEYGALISGLKAVKILVGKTARLDSEVDPRRKAKNTELECKLDSELVVKQLNHEYKLKDERIQKFFIEIWNLMIEFGKVSFVHIPREENKEADKLVNKALDENKLF